MTKKATNNALAIYDGEKNALAVQARLPGLAGPMGRGWRRALVGPGGVQEPGVFLRSLLW